MSPFALYLRQLRVQRGLKQKDAADLLGYAQSYISALERSAKGPPKRHFIRRLTTVMALDDMERLELEEAVRKSKRHISLPCRASAEEYEVMRQLECQLGRLHPAQLALIRRALMSPVDISAMTNPGDIAAPCNQREAVMT